MKNMINRTHIEGVIYEHDLQVRVTGENSKNPGTEFIMGTVSIATDDAMTNIVPVHFTSILPSRFLTGISMNFMHSHAKSTTQAKRQSTTGHVPAKVWTPVLIIHE